MVCWEAVKLYSFLFWCNWGNLKKDLALIDWGVYWVILWWNWVEPVSRLICPPRLCNFQPWLSSSHLAHLPASIYLMNLNWTCKLTLCNLYLRNTLNVLHMTKSVIPQAFANILTLFAFFWGKSGNINSLHSSHGLKKNDGWCTLDGALLPLCNFQS